ncbi:hypothetical protein LTR70_006706 [Exophiala xenobiotica]|nr:hypothetical protein LTR70_006706 [Exophiala xenobiotica]
MTAAEFEQYGPDETQGVELRHLEVADEESADILQYFPQECGWIDNALSATGAGVLVHCQQGVSRSVAFVVAYLMKRFKLSYREGLKLVKSDRSIVNVNAGFEGQLRSWERELQGFPTAIEPTSPKSPVKEINATGVIDFVEAERN